jgi:hypothetical protein
MAPRIGRYEKMSLILSFCMYYLSFTPLWVTVLFIDIKSLIEGGDYKGTEIISVVCIIVFWLIALIYLLLYFKKSQSGFFEEYEIVKVKECKMITAEFLLSYILPLFAFDFCIWDQVVEFLIFFSVLGFLCVRHNYISVNIILEIMKYKIYECELKNNDSMSVEKLVISRDLLNLRKGYTIKFRLLNNDILLAIESDKK